MSEYSKKWEYYDCWKFIYEMIFLQIINPSFTVLERYHFYYWMSVVNLYMLKPLVKVPQFPIVKVGVLLFWSVIKQYFYCLHVAYGFSLCKFSANIHISGNFSIDHVQHYTRRRKCSYWVSRTNPSSIPIRMYVLPCGPFTLSWQLMLMCPIRQHVKH